MTRCAIAARRWALRHEPQTNWAIEGRAKWLQAAANIFDLIYKGSGEIDIKAKADLSMKE